MIIKRRGDIAELLMLQPVIRELKFRNSELDIYIETDYPEVFRDDENIVYAAPFIDSFSGGKVLDVESCTGKNKNLIEEFALAILGDVRIGDWKSNLLPREDEKNKVREFCKNLEPPIMTVSFEKRFCPLQGSIVDDFVNLALEEFTVIVLYDPCKLYTCIPVCSMTDTKDLDWGLHEIQAAIEFSDFYFGLDGQVSMIASTTNTPMVKIFGLRDMKLHYPFRGKAKYIGIESGPCNYRGECLKIFDNGRLQKIECVNEEEFCCVKGCSAKDLFTICKGLYNE